MRLCGNSILAVSDICQQLAGFQPVIFCSHHRSAHDGLRNNQVWDGICVNRSRDSVPDNHGNSVIRKAVNLNEAVRRVDMSKAMIRTGDCPSAKGMREDVGRRSYRSAWGNTIIVIFMALSQFSCSSADIHNNDPFKPINELFCILQVFVKNPTLKNMKDLFATMSSSYIPYSRYLFNSIMVSVLGTAACFIVAMAAYAFASIHSRGKIIFNMIVFSPCFPDVTGVPRFIIMSKMKILIHIWRGFAYDGKQPGFVPAQAVHGAMIIDETRNLRGLTGPASSGFMECCYALCQADG